MINIAAESVLSSDNQVSCSLSFEQERFCLFDQLGMGCLWNQEQNAVQIVGPLNVALLEESVNEIIKRHEVFRTRFIVFDEHLRQTVSSTLTYDLLVTDVVAKDDEALQALINQAVQAPVDLITGPLWQISLLRLNEENHLLVLAMHRILSNNGCSNGIFFKELGLLYGAKSKGQISPLHPLPMQYTEFVGWQKQNSHNKGLKLQVDYWKQLLTNDAARLDLPIDRSRIQVQSYSAGRQELIISKELTQGLKLLSQHAQVSLFSTLLAVFKTLLYRYTHQENICISSPAVGRSHPDTQNLIGCFGSPLLLHTNLAGHSSFHDLLSHIHQVTTDALNYQNCSIREIIETLQLEQDVDLASFCQVLFVFQDASQLTSSHALLPTLDLPGLTITPVEVDSRIEPCDLRLVIQEHSDGLVWRWNYNCNLFEAATIERMLVHCQNLLSNIVADPHQPLTSYSLLNDAERHRLLVEWNSTHVEFPQVSVHKLFAKQVEQTPHATAVVAPPQATLMFGDKKELTYQELNHRANQVAHYLQAQYLSDGNASNLIGLCVGRDLSMAIGVLGILKAGAAYVPLDPTYPKERLQFMLENAGVRVLLTTQQLLTDFPELVAVTHGVQLVCLDTEWDVISGQSHHNATDTPPSQLAYVIHTSGSTGKPKGVAMPHRALSNLLYWQQENIPGAAGTLQFAPISFDVSFQDIFSTWCAGGTLFLISEETRRDPVALLQFLHKHKIERIFLPFVGLQQLAEVVSHAALPFALQDVITAGEQLRITPAIANFFKQLPNCSLHNQYGPTESHVVTAFTLTGEVDNWPVLPSIGRPIANSQTYILDQDLEPVPHGMIGELYLGGICLADGYLNRPELNEERFIVNPFGGGRLYKTGDLARHLADGNIQCLGRADNQVKIRGFRVELEEIEVALSKYPTVREAVVLARGDSGSKHLVTYVVPQNSPQKLETAAPGQEAPRDNGADAEQVSHWEQVWDATYSQSTIAQDPTLNLLGWRDSYTEQPIPKAQMHEWVETTVERILSERPKRVLELGCGTGMLLFRIAPHCDTYVGTDLSQKVLHLVEQQLHRIESDVRLYHRAADNFDGLEAEEFDAVVINSVVELFPSVDYLVNVLKKAVQQVAPGGCIFIGDIRNYALLEAFHASVQLHQAPDSLSMVQLQHQISHQLNEETQLTVDPAFFSALKQQLPQISHVQIQLRRGHHHNEMTRFRYDVILHIQKSDTASYPVKWLDWQKDSLNLSGLRQILQQEQPQALGIQKVPNARVLQDIRLLELLASGASTDTVGQLRQQLNLSVTSSGELEPTTSGYEPEDFWALDEELPYASYVNWSGAKDCYDVVYQRREANTPIIFSNTLEERSLSWSAYANNPGRGQLSRQLEPKLRSYLAESLPEYMVPRYFVVLDALPLTPSGKINNRALPAPMISRPVLSTKLVEPQTEEEKLIAAVWKEVLHLDMVGIHDNFFELGGHSLLLTQVYNQLVKAGKFSGLFGAELTMVKLFEYPTIQTLATYICNSKGQLASPLMNGSTMSEEASENGILLDNVSITDFPLSSSQAEVYAATRLAAEQNSALYIAHFRFKVDQPVDLERLEQAFAVSVQRHPMLHVAIQGNQQHVRTNVEIKLESADYLRPFDLANDLPIRLAVSDDRYQVDLIAHHIVIDGFSLALLSTELFAEYATPGTFDVTNAPKFSYAHFVNWQKSIEDNHTTFWQAELEGAPSVSALPYDYPAPEKQLWTGGTVRAQLSAETVATLDAITHDYTLPTLLTSLVAVLLQRYTGDPELVLGLLSLGRSRREWINMVGHFIKVLPIRIDLLDDDTLTDLTNRVGEKIVSCTQHQDGDIPRHKVAAVVNCYALPVIEGAKLQFPEQLNGQFDLAFWFIRNNDGSMNLEIKYGDDRFTKSTAEMMAQQLSTLLQSAADNPNQVVSALDIQNQTETQQYLTELHTLDREIDHSQCVTTLMAQVDSIIPAMGELSYGEFHQKTDRLAATILQALQGTTKQQIGLYMENGPTLVLSIWAALKTGRAYVPLEPKYPMARLESMIEDANVGIIATQSSLMDEARNRFPDLLVLNVDELNTSTGPVAQGWLPQVKPDNLAYILFTSGTTGRPKGVMVSHGALSNRIQWAQKQYKLTDRDVVLQKTPFTFDVSVWEFVWPLAVGAQVVASPPGAYRDPGHLLDLIETYGVTVMHFVPSMLHVFLEHPRLAAHQLKHVICSGEALPRASCDRFFNSPLRNVRLHNLYGPTEGCIDVTFWECQPDCRQYVPIGKPVSNTPLYVVQDGKLAPPGCPGELWIGGVQVAEGYSNRDDLTAKRFIHNPFSDGMVYRTGDLARWRYDNALMYLGRMDRQVKLRGQRIELGEIEAILSAAPDVERAVVVMDEQGGRQRLLAFLTPEQSNLDKVKTYAAQHLTAYMVPEGMAAYDSLPLSNHGKIDSRALISAYNETVENEVEIVHLPLDTETERLVAAAIAQVLNNSTTLGKDDSFFALGGDSLSVIEFVIAIERTLKVSIQLSVILATPTIEQIAAHVDSLGTNTLSTSIDVSSVLVPSAEAGNQPDCVSQAYHVTDMQAHALEHYGTFFHGLSAAKITDEQQDTFEIDRFVLALQNQIARHVTLYSVFWKVNDKWLQGFRQPTPLPIPIIDLRDLSDDAQKESIATAMDEWNQQLFSVESGESLLRFKIFWLQDNCISLAVNPHHAIYDGWSDAALMYAAYSEYRGLEISHKPLSQTYLERVALEHIAVDKKSVQEFWSNYLQGLPIHTASEPISNLKSVSFDLSDALVEHIETIKDKLGITARSVMLNAFTTMVNKYLGDECVGVVTNTRTPQMTQPLEAVGFYWNILPIRHLPGDMPKLQKNLLDLEMDGRAHYPPSRLPKVYRTLFMFTDFAALRGENLGFQMTNTWWKDFQTSRIHATVLWKEGGRTTSVLINAPAVEVDCICKQYKQVLELMK